MKRLQALFASTLLCCAALFSQAWAQNYVEWSTETRTSLAFRVNAAAVVPLLPQGWQLAPLADAPGQVALSVTFMDRHVVLDAQGQSVRSGTSRYMVMSVQARNGADGQPGTMIINGISPEGPGAYEVYQPATVARVERTTTGQGEEAGRSEEAWELAAQSGDSVSMTLHYQRATPCAVLPPSSFAPGVARRSPAPIRSIRRRTCSARPALPTAASSRCPSWRRARSFPASSTARRCSRA